MASEDEDLARCGHNDTVSLKNLRLSRGIIAPIWGAPKEQPCLVSVNLVLSRGFDSAAGKDALDENTIHYGTLAKSIRTAAGGKSSTLVELHEVIENVISELCE